MKGEKKKRIELVSSRKNMETRIIRWGRSKTKAAENTRKESEMICRGQGEDRKKRLRKWGPGESLLGASEKKRGKEKEGGGQRGEKLDRRREGNRGVKSTSEG